MTMKEIKDFVDMMEKIKQDAEYQEQCTGEAYDTGIHDALKAVISLKEYQALKSLANAPKIKVTDEMISVAIDQIPCFIAKDDMRDALEVVFASMLDGRVEERQNNDGWIEWSRWNCPAPDEMVEVKYTSGENSIMKGRQVNWHNPNLIAYRIIEEQPTHYDAGEALSKVANKMKKPLKQTLKEFYIDRNELSTPQIMHIITEISEYLEQNKD